MIFVLISIFRWVNQQKSYIYDCLHTASKFILQYDDEDEDDNDGLAKLPLMLGHV